MFKSPNAKKSSEKDSRLLISIPWGNKCESHTLGFDKNALFIEAYLISFSARAKIVSFEI